MKVAGLVVGTRKAATTWVYANLLADERFCVSDKVKESGFFAGSISLDFEEYCKLYSPREGQYCVEVDTSICYAQNCVDRINRYAPAAKVVLVLRNPVDYLVSRYIHSTRKGEISANSIAEAVETTPWLREELDYPRIVSRLEQLGEGRLLLLSYESLIEDNLSFMRKVVSHLSGGRESLDDVLVNDKQNVARNSTFPLLSRILSSAAKFARRYQLHALVNVAKGTGVLKLIECGVKTDAHSELRKQAESVIEKNFRKSVDVWKSVNRS